MTHPFNVILLCNQMYLSNTCHSTIYTKKHYFSAEHIASKSPRLFTFSARTEEGLEYVLDQVQSVHPENIELQALLQEASNTSPATHPYRGYAILNQEGGLKESQVCLKY